jgi:DNA-binding transcriptional MerR regulator
METNDGRMYSIGDLARRAGLPVRTIRFWSDAGVVPETGRSPAGHRIYDDRALARLELVAALRRLGLGLETVRSVLENRTTVAEVAELHARALDAEIQALKLRRAVLLAVARQGLDMEGMRMVSDLASLSAAERKRLVDDFISDTFGGVEDRSGIGERMREVTSSLPDDPSTEQVDAWVEVARMVQDPRFRDRVRQMAEAGAREKDSIDREAGKDFAAKIAEHATPAVEAGIDPESQEAAQIVDRIVAGRAGRAQVAEQLATFADGRVDRYWHLVGVINGWPPFPSAFKSYEWVIEALRAHA